MSGAGPSRAVLDFLGEAEEILEKLNLDLVALGDCAERSETDPDLLNSIFRGAHSLKGLSGMVGFDDIADLSHHLENLLDSLRLGKIPFDDSLVSTLFEGLELLVRLVNGKGQKEDFTCDYLPLLSRIDTILCGGGQDSPGDLLAGLQIDPGILKVLTEFEEHRLLENIKQGRNILLVTASFSLASFDQELASLTETLKREGEVISTLPSADIADPERIGFNLLIGSALEQGRISLLIDQDGVSVSELGPRGESAAETPRKAESTATQEPEEQSASLRSVSRTVRVDIDKLDELMNIVGELVLSKGAVSEICEKLRVHGRDELANDLSKATRTLERRLEELQKGVMEVRMVPVSQLFDKMTRIVRRVASELGKKVALDIRGADTELDKLIVEELSDPLMHIIRNAIDHGLEDTSERQAQGKPEKGTICLWAAQKGNHVVIEVRDDGRGIDLEAVQRKALSRGLIDEDDDLSREELFDLIFLPGFSTRDEVSELSGRGVGMDVVKANIAALSGMVDVDSQIGEGTTLSITLPITLAIIKALIVQVGTKTYAVPINSVMETLKIEHSSIRTIERREVIELRDQTLPLLRLAQLFDLPETKTRNSRSFVVVVGLAEKKMGIVVDELLGQQDVVIKPLGEALSFVRGIAGAADLGNQRTILVLDVGGLMNEALKGDSGRYV